MRKIKFIAVGILMLLITATSRGQWTTTGSDISNSNTGNVGVGTSSPTTKLHVNGDISADAGIVKFPNNYPGSSLVPPGSIGFTTSYGFQVRAKTGTYFDFGFYDPAGNTYLLAYPGSNNLLFGADIIMNPTKKLWLDGGSDTYINETSANVIGFTTAGSERLRINESGQIGIGVTSIPSGYKMAVATGIITEKMRVKLQSAGWPDYVFDKSFHLKSLKEVEDFIKSNRHLPDVPSAAEVGKNGIDLGENQAVLLKKIEELTLYLIELNKEVKELKAENTEIKKQLAEKKK